MVTDVLKTRVSPDTKARVNEAVQRQLLTESVGLRRVVDAALRNSPVSEVTITDRASMGSRAPLKVVLDLSLIQFPWSASIGSRARIEC